MQIAAAVVAARAQSGAHHSDRFRINTGRRVTIGASAERCSRPIGVRDTASANHAERTHIGRQLASSVSNKMRPQGDPRVAGIQIGRLAARSTV